MAHTQWINHADFDVTFMDSGECRKEGVPNSYFFAELGRSASERIAAREAQAVCLRCSVRVECFQYALDTQQHGIWGATTRADRLYYRTHGHLPGERP